MRNAPAPSCLREIPTKDTLEPARTENSDLLEVSRRPWLLRVGRTPLIVRPSSARDLAAVAHMHARCTPRTLLDRYRAGGRSPAVAAIDSALRERFSVVAATSEGEVVAVGTLKRDALHNHYCAEVGLLIEDRWQHLGIGAELTAHLAGVAQVAGFHELIAYPATAVPAAQRLLVEIGRTRMVPAAEAHLHTYLPESATLGLGSVRQRLAG
jgi:GNAT superfamily N-acetyltransferase